MRQPPERRSIRDRQDPWSRLGRPPLGPQSQRQVSASARAKDAERIGLHPVLRRMQANEPHCAMHVFGNLRNNETWLRTVDHGKHRVAP